LLAASDEKVGGKIIEEAAEVVEAAAEVGDAGRQHLIYELGDLTYHMLVLMRKHEIALGEVEQELARRFGVSGLTEKASRHSSDSPGT
jgi:phosphoribosyl-ATP pyrophosphohydrolase